MNCGGCNLCVATVMGEGKKIALLHFIITCSDHSAADSK